MDRAIAAAQRITRPLAIRLPDQAQARAPGVSRIDDVPPAAELVRRLSP